MVGYNLFIIRTYFTRKADEKNEKFSQPAQIEKNMGKVTKFGLIFCENGIWKDNGLCCKMKFVRVRIKAPKDSLSKLLKV